MIKGFVNFAPSPHTISIMAEPKESACRLKEQGLKPGSCRVKIDGKHALACQATLKEGNGKWYRLITSIHLSRPENYLSIYQSGCNFSCRKCHSWYFSKVKDGRWYSPQDILEQSVAYEKIVNLWEPREKTTSWHAHDSCRSCGSCILQKKRPDSCPNVLPPESILLSPQGFGPARNIVAFTGGDITCRPEFYAECATLIKAQTKLWLLIETNGYGLSAQNLDHLKEAGVDAFWLDIKAFDPEKHKWLTGCSNEHILKLPEEMIKRGFSLEVLSLYIPDLVETEELVKIAQRLKETDPDIPFTILAFFPEHRMKDFRSPTVEEIVDAYQGVKSKGLKNIRLGNVGIFARSEKDQEYLISHVDKSSF
ncbi:MAG: radical SAM protein [Desulfobacteraceae bacterium]